MITPSPVNAFLLSIDWLGYLRDAAWNTRADKVAAFSERARLALTLDAYAMSAALVFAQVRDLARPVAQHNATFPSNH